VYWICILLQPQRVATYFKFTCWIWGSHIDEYEKFFWDITPCSALSVNRRFGGTCRLHLEGRKDKLSKKSAWKQMARLPSSGSKKPAWKQLATCFHANFLLGLFFRPWRWRWHVPPKLRLTLNGLHGVILQKMVLFFLSSLMAYSSILKMGKLCTSEMSMNFHRTTLRHIPKDIIL
jgi:hypothetical protein